MFAWKKLGKVFDPTRHTTGPWMKEFAQAPNTLILDHAVRVFFSCRPLPDSNKQATSYIGYVDLDKQELTNVLGISERPVLKLGGAGAFDEFGTMPITLVPKKNEVWGYYGGWTRCDSVPFNIAIGLCISRDKGETFSKYGSGPVLSYTPEEPFLVGVPKIRRFDDTFYLFYTAGKRWIVVDGRPEAVYKIRMAISKDGIHWKKQNKDLIADRLGENEAQAGADVIHKNGTYHMFFCYRHTSDFRTNKSRTYRIGYASSANLVDWERNDSEAGIDVSPDGWDSEMISFPHVFDLNHKTYLLYLGNQFGRKGFGIAESVGHT